MNLEMSLKGGSINLILGCMFSGKSTETMRIIKRYQTLGNKKILVINNIADSRYGESVISSHDKQQIKCISLSSLNSIKTQGIYINSQIIFIDEAQFFNDLYDFCTNAADNDNKIVYVTGLNGDSNRNTFGDICKLVPHAEDITMLKALCMICKDGTPAVFSKRIVNCQNQKLIGESDMYIPTCRNHFNN